MCDAAFKYQQQVVMDLKSQLERKRLPNANRKLSVCREASQ